MANPEQPQVEQYKNLTDLQREHEVILQDEGLVPVLTSVHRKAVENLGAQRRELVTQNKEALELYFVTIVNATRKALPTLETIQRTVEAGALSPEEIQELIGGLGHPDLLYALDFVKEFVEDEARKPELLEPLRHVIGLVAGEEAPKRIEIKGKPILKLMVTPENEIVIESDDEVNSVSLVPQRGASASFDEVTQAKRRRAVLKTFCDPENVGTLMSPQEVWQKSELEEKYSLSAWSQIRSWLNRNLLFGDKPLVTFDSTGRGAKSGIVNFRVTEFVDHGGEVSPREVFVFPDQSKVSGNKATIMKLLEATSKENPISREQVLTTVYNEDSLEQLRTFHGTLRPLKRTVQEKFGSDIITVIDPQTRRTVGFYLERPLTERYKFQFADGTVTTGKQGLIINLLYEAYTQGKGISYGELAERVYGENTTTSRRNVGSHTSRLRGLIREKLGMEVESTGKFGGAYVRGELVLKPFEKESVARTPEAQKLKEEYTFLDGTQIKGTTAVIMKMFEYARVENKNLSYEDLAEALYGENTRESRKKARAYVSVLRKILRPGGLDIVSIRKPLDTTGVGGLFLQEIQPEEEDPLEDLALTVEEAALFVCLLESEYAHFENQGVKMPPLGLLASIRTRITSFMQEKNTQKYFNDLMLDAVEKIQNLTLQGLLERYAQIVKESGDEEAYQLLAHFLALDEEVIPVMETVVDAGLRKTERADQNGAPAKKVSLEEYMKQSQETQSREEIVEHVSSLEGRTEPNEQEIRREISNVLQKIKSSGMVGGGTINQVYQVFSVTPTVVGGGKERGLIRSRSGSLTEEEIIKLVMSNRYREIFKSKPFKRIFNEVLSVEMERFRSEQGKNQNPQSRKNKRNGSRRK